MNIWALTIGKIENWLSTISSKHTQDEVEFLKRLAKATMNMTHDEHRKFVSDLDVETYKKVVCNR